MPLSPLLQYLERISPGFLETVQAADAEQVAEAHTLSGGRLPNCYLEFLETMGISTGRLKIKFASFDITAVNRRNLEERAQYPAGLFLIGIGDNIMGTDVFLDLGRSTGEDAPVVQAVARPTAAPIIFSRSFFGMLSDFAFHQLAIAAKRHQLGAFIATYADSDAGHLQFAHRLGDVLRQVGFAPALDIGDDGQLLERPDCNARVRTRQGTAGVSFELASDDPRPSQEVMAIVQDHMDEIGGTLRIRKNA
jgi:hypothetical protein